MYNFLSKIRRWIFTYEFSKKEVRSKFKETEYGKKVNTWLYISEAIALPFFLLFILSNCGVISCSQNTSEMINYAFLLFAMVVCYFDGKRDGAIEQFKRSLK